MQPKIKEYIETRVMDTGDTMTGELLISTSGMYGFRKNRGISGVNYQSCFGTINDGGPTAGIDLYNLDTSTQIARLFLHPDKIIFTTQNGTRNILLHNNNYTEYTLAKTSSINMLGDINASANLGKYSSIFRTTTTNCDGVAPSTYSIICRFRSGYNGSYDLWLSGDVNGNFHIAKTADGTLASSDTWKKIAIFDANHALSTNNYTNQSTVPLGGIKIHDIRDATINPGSFGSYVANFYFDIAANGTWKTVLNMTGWSAGSYASHELAFNSSTDISGSDNKSIWHRTGIDGSWNSWLKILDSNNYSSYALPLSGGTITGQIKINKSGGSWNSVIISPNVNYIYADHSSATSSVYHSMLALRYANHTFSIGGERAGETFGIYAYLNTRTDNGYDASFYISNDLNFYCSTKLYGAVWNDYAEYRSSDTLEPGRVVVETGEGDLILATERLQPGANIISDTFGFAIGQTDECQTPIAVAGRVLVHPFQERDNYKPGQCVCAAPGGTVDIMTDEEVAAHPDRIVGTVSNVPSYEEWGGGPSADREPVKVNGRIWIKVR